MSDGVRQRAARVKMVIMDVDGVLTDAGMYYGESGEEMKKFNTRDGLGIRLLHEAGILTALVTGERTAIVARRAAKLGIAEVHQGVADKLPVVESLLERHGLSPEQACYVGDDLGDLAALRYVGFAVAVADAVPQIRRVAHYITYRKGGEGAVRELCDLILSSRRASVEHVVPQGTRPSAR